MKKLDSFDILIIAGLFFGFKYLGGVARAEVNKRFNEAQDKFNPASDKNVVYTGVNKGLQNVTGNKVDTLGTAAYGWLHNDDGSLKFPWQKPEPLDAPRTKTGRR